MYTSYYFSFNQMLIIAIVCLLVGFSASAVTNFFTLRYGPWRYKRAWLLEDENGKIVQAQYTHPYYDGEDDEQWR